MAQVIPFHIPEGFVPKSKRLWPSEPGRVLEFPRPELETFSQPTWIIPEVDGDLSMPRRMM